MKRILYGIIRCLSYQVFKVKSKIKSEKVGDYVKISVYILSENIARTTIYFYPKYYFISKHNY